MTYTPKIVSPDEVRTFFTPFLSHDDIDDMTLLAKIEAVERYVSDVYFEGSYPASAKVPCILLVASKVMMEPKILYNDKYSPIKKIGDITYESPKSISPYQQAKSWEQMALQMLDYQRTKWVIKLAYG